MVNKEQQGKRQIN